MDTKIKNYLGVALIVAVLLLGISAFYYTHSYASSLGPDSYRSFGVSGEGKVVAVPDVAEFSFSVVTEGKLDITELQKENTDKMNKAIAFVKKNGVKNEDIETQNYNVDPRYSRCDYTQSDFELEKFECPPPTIVGYTITQRVSVKVRDFDKIGEILAGIVNYGVNNVSQLYFTIDDPTELENQARMKAIAQAKEKAKAYAEAGGFRIGDLISIDEDNYGTFYGKGGGYADAVMMESSMRAAPAPVIAPGSQEVTITVRMSYAIR